MRPSTVGLLLTCISIPFAVVALPSSIPCAHKVKETVFPPHGWVKHSTPAANHTIVLRIGLPQPNFHVLEKHLYEVSDPNHERYGAHLSNEEVDELVAPHQESIDLVNEWLQSHGIGENDLVRSRAKDWVTVRIPVSVVEKMLDTNYHIWKHTDGEYIVRTTSYSLPSNLHDHIDVIQPTTSFGRAKGAKSTIVWLEDQSTSPVLAHAPAFVDSVSGITVNASCNTTITLSCIQQMYDFVGYTPSSDTGNSIGITGYLGQYANLEDLQLFYADQRPDALGSSYSYYSVNGGLNDQNASLAGIEANLDTQFAFGISHPIASTFWSTGGSPPYIPDALTTSDTNEPYANWLDYIFSHPNTPLTISTSYGDDEQTVPETYARRVCAEFAVLGVKGVSLMFSSGDYGVGDGNPNPATQHCFSNDGKNTTMFLPAFPASCPYVTSVGGTVMYPEVAVSRFFSGGGFSNYFVRPPYQEYAATKYLEALAPGTYQGLYNPYGRGIPDVAAQSDRFRIFVGGQPILIGGTSASSPTFAGVVSLLNDVRLSKGQPPLGFLNPLLYTKGIGGLNDITVGHNSGCGTTGFNVTVGWDPVTGLGSPDFGKLAQLVLL